MTPDQALELVKHWHLGHPREGLMGRAENGQPIYLLLGKRMALELQNHSTDIAEQSIGDIYIAMDRPELRDVVRKLAKEKERFRIVKRKEEQAALRLDCFRDGQLVAKHGNFQKVARVVKGKVDKRIGKKGNDKLRTPQYMPNRDIWVMSYSLVLDEQELSDWQPLSDADAKSKEAEWGEMRTHGKLLTWSEAVAGTLPKVEEVKK